MGAPIVDLGPLLDAGRVTTVAGTPTKTALLLELAELTASGLGDRLRTALTRAVLEREEVASTAIGGGVAVPHARLAGLAGPRIAIARCAGGVDFSAPDGKLVHLAVMLASCESDHRGHLRVLAALALRLRDPAVRAEIVAATDGAGVVAALRG